MLGKCPTTELIQAIEELFFLGLLVVRLRKELSYLDINLLTQVPSGRMCNNVSSSPLLLFLCYILSICVY